MRFVYISKKTTYFVSCGLENLTKAVHTNERYSLTHNYLVR